MGDLDSRVDAKFIQIAFLVAINANVHVKILGPETFVRYGTQHLILLLPTFPPIFFFYIYYHHLLYSFSPLIYPLVDLSLILS